MKRLFVSLIAVLFAVDVWAQKPGDVVILYENDVHCAVDGYPVIAGLRDSLVRMGCPTAVVSAGDFSFGGPIGAATKGEFIVRLMNAVGYDVAVLGNHEFDYGMPQLRLLENRLDCPLVCCNFRAGDDPEGYPFPPFVLRRIGDVNVAFVGVTTPTTMYTSNPASFKDADGAYLYNFSSSQLAATLQRSIDAARAAGADVVAVLSHLGDADGVPTSLQVLSQISGADVVLDGHDHHVLPSLMAADKSGTKVPVSSTGTQFEKIGMLIIGQQHSVCTALLTTDSLKRRGCVSRAVADTVKAIQEQFDALGARTIATADADLVAEEGDIRVCRLRETNLGDLVADAYRILMGADVGWVNGGGIRANVAAGAVSHNQLFAVCPYGNAIRVIRTTGQTILDALETAVREYPKAEGCFPQVSGMSFVFDPSAPSGVVLDSNGTFLRVEGSRRVKEVEVGGKPLDPKGFYTIAGTEYILLKGGDAISFPGAEVLQTEEVSDLDILERYILNNLHGRISTPYGKPQGRILNTAVDNIPKPKKPEGSLITNQKKLDAAPENEKAGGAIGKPTVAPVG